MKKLRITGATLALRAVVDDGEHLTEVQLPPLSIAAKEIATFATETLPKVLAKIEQQFTGD